ncbi:hypothetical protein [Cyanobium gracile]|uniref:Uncharacterized protein n=1 Tax=Cyanobium gracile UHCC 0281 TaxID=3110309 RepID=A0ABU5SSX2_9CYAN|nr:hypothetical protein [Cyanobium gracile]MEA5441589.1 hypothetical protein [Cyanobium gracile UHCC 0281]
MEFRGTVRSTKRNGLGLLLTPLVLIRRFVQSVALALERMIWRELIEADVPANPLVNLLAFLLFSSLCLLVSLQGAVAYVIGLLLFLLPMEWLIAQLGYGSPVERRVLLHSWGDRIRLWSQTRQGSEHQEIRRAAIEAVVIRFSSLSVPPLGERPLGWDVGLAVGGPGGEQLLARSPRLSAAWQQASSLAGDLGVPLHLVGTTGPGTRGPSTIQRIPIEQEAGVWRVLNDVAATRIVRNRFSVGALQWWRSFAEQGSYLLFVAALNTVMVKYGGFLVWMLGPRLGLSEPTTLMLDLSVPGLLSLALPEWTVIQTLLVVAALGAAGLGSVQQWSPQELTLAADRVTYRRAGQPAQSLPTRMITEALLLHEPEPQVILWSERRPPLVMGGLSNEGEALELLEKLQAALAPWRPTPPSSSR